MYIYIHIYLYIYIYLLLYIIWYQELCWNYSEAKGFGPTIVSRSAGRQNWQPPPQRDRALGNGCRAPRERSLPVDDSWETVKHLASENIGENPRFSRGFSSPEIPFQYMGLSHDIPYFQNPCQRWFHQNSHLQLHVYSAHCLTHELVLLIPGTLVSDENGAHRPCFIKWKNEMVPKLQQFKVWHVMIAVVIAVGQLPLSNATLTRHNDGPDALTGYFLGLPHGLVQNQSTPKESTDHPPWFPFKLP